MIEFAAVAVLVVMAGLAAFCVGALLGHLLVAVCVRLADRSVKRDREASR